MEAVQHQGPSRCFNGPEESNVLLNLISHDQSMEELQDSASSPIMINPQHPVKDPGKIYCSSNFKHSYQKATKNLCK